MMKKTLLLFLLACGTALGAAAQDALLGKWWSPKRDGQIEFYKNNGKYFGRLVWAQKSEKRDTHNPDPALRARPLVGSSLFTNFNWDGDEKEWIDGKVYDPTSGKIYHCKLWITDGGKTLNARGYVGFSLLGRTEKFARVE